MIGTAFDISKLVAFFFNVKNLRFSLALSVVLILLLLLWKPVTFST